MGCRHQIPDNSEGWRGFARSVITMQPHLIRSTADSAMTLLGERGRGTPEALLLSWVAWEGLRIRLLVVALRMQGWQVKDVYDALSSERFHSTVHYDNLFRSIFGSKPQSAKGVGQRWSQLEAFRATRNAFVHGTRGGSPLRLEAGVHLLRDSVLDPGWLAILPVRTSNGREPVGDVYRRLPSQHGRARSVTELRQLVRDSHPRR